MVTIRIQTEDFAPGPLLEQIGALQPDIGAVASFIGMVRAQNLAADVLALELEHYPGMTEKSLHQIAHTAASRWPLAAITIIHRVGKLYVGDRIVLVATASSHRQAAFAACEFLMDQLKTTAPFWKKEWTAQGPRWVEARQSDHDAASRWDAAGQKGTP